MVRTRDDARFPEYVLTAAVFGSFKNLDAPATPCVNRCPPYCALLLDRCTGLTSLTEFARRGAFAFFAIAAKDRDEDEASMVVVRRQD